MDDTGRERRNTAGTVFFNSEANIATGVRYLKELIDYYDGDTGRALEAYNAGLTNVNLEKHRPKYKETRAYLGRIAKLLATDETTNFVNLYDLNSRGRGVLRGLFLFSTLLWALFLIWVKKHRA